MALLPKLSIITPTYNQGGFIEETIKSILRQNHPNLEHIVIDGGSTDSTLSILKNYERDLRWISEPDRGQADAINKGLRMATGDVVAYLNSDDLYEPEALSTVGEFFAGNPQAMWATGFCRNVNEGGYEIRQAITLYKNLWLHARHLSVLLVLNFISQPATFWRRAVLDDVGYFDEDLHYVMDYDYWLRAITRYPLWLIERNLASFRIHRSSKGGTSAHLQFSEELKVAGRYTHSSLLLSLHRLHATATVNIYRRLSAWQPKPTLTANGP